MTISVPADVLSRLKAVLGEGGWSQDPERLAPKLLEWRDRWKGYVGNISRRVWRPHSGAGRTTFWLAK